MPRVCGADSGVSATRRGPQTPPDAGMPVFEHPHVVELAAANISTFVKPLEGQNTILLEL
jgi:hypothetical protein